MKVGFKKYKDKIKERE